MARRHALRGSAAWWVAFPCVVGCVVACTIASPALAYFERVVPSARIVALGGAFVAVADDPAAIAANPAGLALARRTGVLATWNRPYGVAGLSGGFAAAAVPLGGAGVLGASWHYLGLRDALSENVVRVGFARHLVATSQDASLSVGATLDFYRAAADQTGRGDNLVTAGVGVLLRPFPSIGMGYSVGNLRQGDIHLLPGGPGTPVRRRQAWGLSVEWHRRVTLAAERRQTATGQWRNHVGAEIVAAPNLHLRGGLDGRFVTAGFGVLWRGARADVAVAPRERLGATYVFTIAWLGEVKNPNGRR